jgi:23S rRNA pseudouridine2605 synthase
MRLAKAIARAGVTSRRKAEQLIQDGCVTVNGRLVEEQGVLVDPSRDHIKVNNRLLRRAPSFVYVVLHKPAGMVTTLHDPEGRPTVLSLVSGLPGRVFPVGRLDFHTEGLLLLTNDGELANRLLHPSSGIERSYLAKVKGIPAEVTLEKLRRGILLDRGLNVRAEVKLHRALKANAWLLLTLREGRYREVRRMCEAAGHPVLKLRRIRFGPLTLEGLPRGKYRHLTEAEIGGLHGAIR